MQGTYCLQYKRLRAGKTSAMKAGTACVQEAEDDSESHK